MKKILKKKVFIFILLLLVFTITIPLFVHAAFLLGGSILFVELCDEGILITVGPPNPGLFMITPFSVYFPRVTLPGVKTLGVAGPPIPCTIAGVPTGKAGLLVLLGGTALVPSP